MGLVADGMKRFDKNDGALYPPDVLGRAWRHARPASRPIRNRRAGVSASTRRRCRRASAGISITLSPFRRPTIECMPVDAKAGCLYPNNGRALFEAGSRGFDNCLMCDMLGNVAELATANMFFAKDGVVYTPAANGTFLTGITRYRTIKLLRDAGVTVVEASLRYSDFQNADEIFSSGNYSKLMPVIRIDDRSLQPGPFYRKARELYWDFAHS